MSQPKPKSEISARMLEYVKSLPQYVAILGNERIMYLEQFAGITPSESTNNQHFMTDVYHVCGNEFHVTHGLADEQGNSPSVEMVMHGKELSKDE